MAQSWRNSTLKISFSNKYPRPKALEIEQFIRDEVKVPSNDVVGINFSIVSSVVYLKLISDTVCDKILNATRRGLKFRHSDGHIGDVTIEHAGLCTIRVFELPFEVPEEEVISALRPYGKVISHVAEKWAQFTTYPVFNGVRQIRIELNKHVPSYLTIGGCRAIIIYDGQPKTCSGCGQEGHVRSTCMQRRITQLPPGDEQLPSAPTTLPLTYVQALKQPEPTPVNDPFLNAALCQGNEDKTEAAPAPVSAPPTQSASEVSPMEGTEVNASVVPTGVLALDQNTTDDKATDQTHSSMLPLAEKPTDNDQSHQQTDPYEKMDVETGVIPTSAFITTGTASASDDCHSHSDVEQHVRKQRSPRQYKKRRRTHSDELRKPKEDEDPASDEVNASATRVSGRSRARLPSHDTAATTVPTDVSDAPLSTAEHTHGTPAETTPRQLPSVTSASWADDIEDESGHVEGAEGGSAPSAASSTALS